MQKLIKLCLLRYFKNIRENVKENKIWEQKKVYILLNLINFIL